jgi:hypothetical protein
VLDESFAEAWVNSPHRILGLRLLPFSLWHRFQLEILDSPLLSGKAVDPLEIPFVLERAVRACRLTYPQTVAPHFNMWSFRWRLAGRDINTELMKFGAYLSDYFAIPKFLPPTRKKDNRPESVNHPPPENIQIFSAVVSMTGWPEEKIWMLPIGQAYWYAAGHWYQSGQELDFLTPEHLILKERIEKLKAAKNG